MEDVLAVTVLQAPVDIGFTLERVGVTRPHAHSLHEHDVPRGVVSCAKALGHGAASYRLEQLIFAEGLHGG